MEKCLLLLSKFPVPGRVKSRLAADIGKERAATIQKGMLLDILSRFLNVPDIAVRIIYPKDEQPEPFRHLCESYRIPCDRLQFTQGIGDMNADIVYGYRSALQQFRKVALIGADFPHYTEAQLNELWDALDTCDAVYHPNPDDGGCPHGLCQWGDMWTGNDSRSPGYIKRWRLKAVSSGLTCHELSPAFDVDRMDDLSLVISQFSSICPFTAAAFHSP